jgi:hypothetical protein
VLVFQLVGILGVLGGIALLLFFVAAVARGGVRGHREQRAEVVDPEGVVRARLDEELQPLRVRLATTRDRRERRRIRREMRRLERTVPRTLRGAHIAWWRTLDDV